MAGAAKAMQSAANAIRGCLSEIASFIGVAILCQPSGRGSSDIRNEARLLAESGRHRPCASVLHGTQSVKLSRSPKQPAFNDRGTSPRRSWHGHLRGFGRCARERSLLAVRLGQFFVGHSGRSRFAQPARQYSRSSSLPRGIVVDASLQSAWEPFIPQRANSHLCTLQERPAPPRA